ncbi:hypothetical protein C3747_209g43 [Trypanosoma cruzi]|uniref:SLACS retrotransposable element n=1 Tax=Trypanosoma cruzi TaxID=5693 RepID=A0A2V2W153_TRYCR|nr:hypothetical protein C3747_209g43 [Trypanosoma cruzi]
MGIAAGGHGVGGRTEETQSYSGDLNNPREGRQMIQGGNRSWQYRDQQPRRYRSQSSLERNNTPAQATRRTQQEVRPGSQGVRRGGLTEQRGPQTNTATPSLPGRREVAPGLPHAGFRGQLTRPKNPHAAIAALAELELQAYQEKHQRYIGATKTLVPWWTALYQSGAQNYHCPLCSFNRPGEHDVFYHCRQAHPTYDKCYPYRLHLNGHCTFPVEKSCSLNAVLAVLSHYEDESQLSQEVRSTYTVPCRENTERIIRAMEVNLPLAPVSALELLIKNDSKLRRMFSTTAVAGTPMRGMRVGPANGGGVSVLLGNTAGRTRRHHLAAGKEGTHTPYANGTDATVPVHVDLGGTRVHRRAACTPSPEVGNDSHQITEIRRCGGTGVRPLGQASDGGGGGPICDPPTAPKRHGGIWTGGTSGHQHPQPCRRLHTKRST